MKRKTAKELLVDSFKELAKNRNIEKITIQEIVDNCGYSPATFYRQFKDKYDLIAWDYVRELDGNVGRVGVEGFTWKEALFRTAVYHQEHRDYLLNLFRHTSGRYSFEQYMAEVNVQYLKKLLLRRCGRITDLMEQCLWVYCYGGVKTTGDWLSGRFEASPEEMAKLYEVALPEPLKEYL